MPKNAPWPKKTKDGCRLGASSVFLSGHQSVAYPPPPRIERRHNINFFLPSLTPDSEPYRNHSYVAHIPICRFLRKIFFFVECVTRPLFMRGGAVIFPSLALAT